MVGGEAAPARDEATSRRRRVHVHRIPEPPASPVPWLAAGVVGVAIAAVVLFGAVEPEHVFPLQGAALVLGAAAVVARARRGARPLPCPAVTVPVLLLCVLPGIQLVLPAGLLPAAAVPRAATVSLAPQATFLALVRWLAYAAFLVAALEALRHRLALRWALGAVAVLGVLEALYGIGNLLVGNQRLLWLPRDVAPSAATGTLVNRNHFAAVLELALPSLLAWTWLADRPPRDRGLAALHLLGAAAMGLALVLSRSRAGTVASAVAVGFVVWTTRGDADGRGARRLVLALAVVVAAYAAWAGGAEAVRRFGRASLDVRSVRLRLWTDTAAIARDFPVLGVGAGAFESVFPAYRRATRDRSTWAHAHMDWLELLAEAGPAAVVAVLAALVAFGRRVRSALCRAAGRRRLALAALTGAVAAVLLHAAVDFPLHIPGVVLVLIVVGACGLRLAQAIERDRGVVRKGRPADGGTLGASS